MEFSEKILLYFSKNNIKPADVARGTGIDKSTFTKWKKNPTSKLDLVTLVKIANYLNVSTDYLLTGESDCLSTAENTLILSVDEQELIDLFKVLSPKDQQRIIGRAEQLAEVARESEAIKLPTVNIKHSLYKVSAGRGYELDEDDNWDEIEVPATPEARRADFCLTILGDSMEPVYYDGDIVLVKNQPQVERGQIGIFIIEGAGYIKKFGVDRLISLNAEYEDIMFEDYNSDDIRCAGLVIGRA